MNSNARDNIQAILFDLDGTLLQVEMQEYIPTYAVSLADKLSHRVAPDKTVDAIFSAISGLINRDSGDTSNEIYFLQQIADRLELAATNALIPAGQGVFGHQEATPGSA